MVADDVLYWQSDHCYESREFTWLFVQFVCDFLFISKALTMFTSVTASKDTFLNQARNARELRHNAKFQNECAIRMQKTVRGWLCRQKLASHIRFDLNRIYQVRFEWNLIKISQLQIPLWSHICRCGPNSGSWRVQRQ